MGDSPADGRYQPWTLLQRGQSAEALAIFRDRYASTQIPVRKRGLGELMPFWRLLSFSQTLSRCDCQSRDSRRLQREQRGGLRLPGCRGMVLRRLRGGDQGVERWNKSDWFDRWRPHSLSTASPSLILRPQLYRRERAERILFKRLNSRYAGGWPASEARFAAGLIDEEALGASWPSTPPLNIRLLGPEAEWKRDSQAARDLAAGIISIEDAKQTWRNLSERSRYGSGEVKDFYNIINIPEFFIADHECTRSPKIEVPIG